MLLFLGTLMLAAPAWGQDARVVVDHWKFDGLAAIDDRDAADRLGLVIGGTLDTVEFKGRLGSLLTALGDEGYLDATARPAITPASEGHADFRVVVVEGARAVFGPIVHDGTDSLTAIVRPRPPDAGRPFRRVELERNINEWLDAYDESGFPYARIRPVDVSVDRMARPPVVTVRMRHEPGPRVVLAALDLKGARSTRPEAVARAIGFTPGTVYQQSRIEEGIRRLERTGLVAAVGDVELLPGDDPTHSRLRLTVREASSGSLAGIVGYSGLDERLSGYLDFRLNNIGGTGRRLAARWNAIEDASTLYRLTYREPFLFGKPLDAAVGLEHTIFDTLYTTTRSELSLFWRVGGRTEAHVTAGLDHVVVTSGLNRNQSSGRYAFGVDFDARTPALAPRSGGLLSGRLARGKTLSGLYGDDVTGTLESILSAGLRAESYHPLGRHGVLALLLTGRSIETSATPVPQYELLPLGGALTLRGYREEQFYTPGYVLGQFEYRILADQNGRGVFLFTDVATFAPQEAEATLWPKFDEVKVGYGAGIRMGSRVGRLGLDYGLAAGEGPLDGRIHLRAETEF
ncbi:MAG TPA: BamA/TamA family outer membrane protein [Candidatus Eisenbacteria bacterium]